MRLGKTAHICDTIGDALELDPPEIFRRAEMLVIDNVPWQADLNVIGDGLEQRARSRKDPWTRNDVAFAVSTAVGCLCAEARDLFAVLYPAFHPVDSSTSFRPMVTGPEPMHFDTKVTKTPLVTAFINVASTPRLYQLGASFLQLMAWHPKLMRTLWREAQWKGDRDVSYVIRNRVEKNLPPLGGSDAPKHCLELAPRAIWFMNAKMVSHEVIYGEGAVHVDWMVEGSGVLSQQDMLA